MQCPNCGFENIPGNERCVVCETALAVKRAGESLMPPRASDRSFWQRMTWPITTSRAWIRTGEDLRRLRGRIAEMQTCAWLASPFSWMGFREFGLILLSVIPGLGHIYVRGDRRTGMCMLLGAAAALALAVLLYKTVLADLLVGGVIALSMFSVCVAVDGFRPMGQDEVRFINRVGVGSWVLAAYVGTFWLLMLAVRPHFMMVNVRVQAPGSGVESGDRLLLRTDAVYHHGDVVAGTGANWTPNVGPVLGVPGDTIRLTDRVYVNGVPTSAVIPYTDEGHQGSREAETVLNMDEYWVMPAVQLTGDAEMLLDAGLMRGDRIWGRALLVIGPPGHRRIMTRGSRQNTVDR